MEELMNDVKSCLESDCENCSRQTEEDCIDGLLLDMLAVLQDD